MTIRYRPIDCLAHSIHALQTGTTGRAMKRWNELSEVERRRLLELAVARYTEWRTSQRKTFPVLRVRGLPRLIGSPPKKLRRRSRGEES